MTNQNKHTTQNSWEGFLELIKEEIENAEYQALEKARQQLEAINKSG